MANSQIQRIHSRAKDSTSLLFVIVFAFYALQFAGSFIYGHFPPHLDFIAALALISLGFIIHLIAGVSPLVPIGLGIGLFFNIIGLYHIIPYEGYVGTLYGAPQLGYHYDWIVHSFGFGFFSLAFSSLMFPYLRKSFRSYYIIFIVLLLCMLGFGAMNEINEYLGYSYLGIGEGFLEFGDGDTSPSEGPWENTSMDLVNNLIGGILFVGGFMLYKKYIMFNNTSEA
ncbi:hypothetical protein GF345_02575 [Candidatus Woesearchaeota archaeon]|nr:hypothetical protein [Candidatus Woesearchaeota archaeon]